MEYKGCRSDTYESESGVARGSNLGYLMFIVFFNDLIEYCKVGESVQKIAHVIRGEKDCKLLQLAPKKYDLFFST